VPDVASPHLSPRAVVAVAARPALWATAAVEVLRLAPVGWWRRRPFLPLPDTGYLRFRLKTQYGDAAHVPEPHDLVTWLRWCRDFGRFTRGSGSG
jgi:hypothetical protein